MNLFPLIHKSKKTHHFANPLNGFMFHSDIQPAKKDALSTISYSEASHTKRNASNTSSLKIKSNYKFKLDHSETPEKEAQSIIKSSKVMKAANLFTEKGQQKATLRLKSQNSFIFRFPDVEILPLYLIHSYEDIGKYRIKVNLEKYFQLYFSNGFRHNLSLLNSMLERNLPLLKKYGMLDQQIEKKKWPKEFWEIKKVEQLTTLMQKYDKPSEYWIKYLLVLAQLYCVPHPTVRQSSLENLLLLTRHHIKHVFQLQQPNTQCVFLLQNGTIVHDFLEIPFSTTRLYLTIKKQTEKETMQSFTSHLSMIQNYKEQCRKKGFVGRLRRHFRNEIALNKYNEDSINYDPDYSSKEKQRKLSLYNAMMVLQRKKQNHSTHTHTNTKTLTSARPKSRQEIWKQENIENESTHNTPRFSFHLYINNHSLQGAIRAQFNKYYQLSIKESAQIKQDEVFIYILEKNHAVLRALLRSPFHSSRVKTILQTLTNQKLSDDRQLSKSTMSWRSFIEFSILCSNSLKKLTNMQDCMLLVRNFVEDFLQISQDDYFRDELTSKLYRLIDADSSTLSMVEELIWSWLTENGFVRLGALQRELLWTYEQRSKTFYLLMVSTILGTYSTTPMDLAFELMI